jgi:hypothetical protein
MGVHRVKALVVGVSGVIGADGAGFYCWVSLTRIEVRFDISEPARGESTMLTSNPTTRQLHPTLGDDFQGDEIGAPDGEELMPA